MALQHLISTKPETPYFRPPPLHVSVVAVRDQPRVVSWEFQESSARAATIKHNKVAAITDGQSVTNVTIFEEFATKLQTGCSYIIRGHTLRGQSPPYVINITKETQFFRSAPVLVSEELRKAGEALLQPASPLTPLHCCKDTQGFMTVEGEVVEVSVVKKLQSGKQAIPLRNVLLKNDSTQVSLCLWREAAVLDLHLRCQIRISHVKCGRSDYGRQLQSSNYTKIEEVSSTLDAVEVIGVTESREAGVLDLLLHTNEVYKIEEAMWAPFEEELKNGAVKINIKVCGNTVTSIGAIKIDGSD